MQGEWGTEKPARFFVISVLFAVVTTPLPFIPSPRADRFSAAVRLGARGEGTGHEPFFSRAVGTSIPAVTAQPLQPGFRQRRAGSLQPASGRRRYSPDSSGSRELQRGRRCSGTDGSRTYRRTHRRLPSYGWRGAACGVCRAADSWGGRRILSLIHISEPTRLGMISYA